MIVLQYDFAIKILHQAKYILFLKAQQIANYLAVPNKTAFDHLKLLVFLCLCVCMSVCLYVCVSVCLCVNEFVLNLREGKGSGWMARGQLF